MALLNWLYLDLNSYFASVEQQLQPELRNRPVAIVPTITDATCAIAASYEAKAYGIKTGTMIYEAKKLCPQIICVEARHKNYVDYHHKILEEIDKHIHISVIASIDEVACKLSKKQNNIRRAIVLAQNIKEGIKENVGHYIRCSIGIAPNRFLAKTASNLEKPDGLQVLYEKDIPLRISHLKLSDLTGIGKGIEKRLINSGISSIESLYNISPKHMRKIWGSVNGERFWYMLRGVEIENNKTERKTVGHSHVLAPEWRPIIQARKVLRRLLLKTTNRLRRIEYHSSSLQISISIEKGAKIKRKCKFNYTHDNFTILKHAMELWKNIIEDHRPDRIKKISITLYNLKKTSDIHPSLFENFKTENKSQKSRYQSLSSAMDKINFRFGKDSITLGNTTDKVVNTKVAFTRIPEKEEFKE